MRRLFKVPVVLGGLLYALSMPSSDAQGRPPLPKGSYDLDMTSGRLAQIRMREEEEACRIIGIPKENIMWLEYHDGMLEYANTRDLVEECAKKRVRGLVDRTAAR